MNLNPELNDLSNKCKELGEPIVITKDGKPDLVVMSFDVYQRRLDLIKLKERLIDAELEGNYYTLEELDASLKKIIS
ncbi:MAG: type II toxin-antitoxin system prevent-host-death family antitoxin [Bacilli bacterium]|nr:type II toxin-antitoxin system prevent-host-death family antitoxin [Bacilli bacterium]